MAEARGVLLSGMEHAYAERFLALLPPKVKALSADAQFMTVKLALRVCWAVEVFRMRTVEAERAGKEPFRVRDVQVTKAVAQEMRDTMLFTLWYGLNYQVGPSSPITLDSTKQLVDELVEAILKQREADQAARRKEREKERRRYGSL